MRLYFWHAFFGVPGAQNDLNVLDCSTLFQGLLEGTAPPVKYVVNDRTYNMGYYLADGIYPEWQIMMKTIPSPQNEKQIWFAKCQEGRRKDVERGFAGIHVCIFCFSVVLLWLIVVYLTLFSPLSHLYRVGLTSLHDHANCTALTQWKSSLLPVLSCTT